MSSSMAGTGTWRSWAIRRTFSQIVLFLACILTYAQANADTITTNFGYDEAGNKVSQTDALGHITRWQYDVGNEQVGRTLPDGRQETFAYDATGHRTQHAAFDGNRAYYAYDNMGRLVLASYPDGRQVRYTYTPTGKVATVQDGTIAPTVTGLQTTGTTKYTYDVMDRVSRVDFQNGRFITYSYNNVGDLVGRGTTDGSWAYGYDPTHKLTLVTDPQGKSATYSYDVNGRLLKTVYPNGIQSLREYNVNGQLTEVAWQNAQGQLLAGAVYTLLPNGQRQTLTRYDEQSALQVTTVPYSNPSTQVTTSREHWALSSPAKVVSYQYDFAKRITQAQEQDSRKGLTRMTNWSYDAVGNRQTQIETATPIDASGNPTGSSSTTTTTYSYDSADRLQQTQTTTSTGGSGSTTYQWDQNGELVRKATPSQVTLLKWSSDGRLLQVSQGDTDASVQVIASYSYDNYGNRVQRSINVQDPTNPNSPTLVPQITDYLVDQTFPFAETLEEIQVTGTMVSRTQYTWGNGFLISADLNNGSPNGPIRNYFEQDGQASVVAITNSQGQPVATYGYGTFGKAYNVAPNDGNAYRYTGEYTDTTTGLQYNRARWYDPEIGRFISIDPAKGLPTEPLTLNKYIYALSDPINNRDPLGRMGMMDVTFSSAAGNVGRAVATTVVVGALVMVIAVELYYLNHEINLAVANAQDASYPIALALSPEEEARKDAEYKIMKDFCDNQGPEEGENHCSYVSKAIDHAEQCLAMYEAWDFKWNPGRHDEKIQTWRNRINNFKDEHRRKCAGRSD